MSIVRSVSIASLLLAAQLVSPPVLAQCEVRIPRSSTHEALGGVAAQGLIRNAKGTECPECENISSFGFGFWSGSAYLAADAGHGNLRLEFDLCAGRIRGFTGAGASGGQHSYKMAEYEEYISGGPRFRFRVRVGIRDPEGGEARYETFTVRLQGDRASPGMHYTATVRRSWPFGAVDLAAAGHQSEAETDLQAIVSTYRVRVTEWELVHAHYPFLMALDAAVGRRIADQQAGGRAEEDAVDERAGTARPGSTANRMEAIKARARQLNESPRHPPPSGNHGALAVHETRTDRYGMAVNASSSRDASRAALDDCGAGCRVVLRFRDACAALAVDVSGGSSARKWVQAVPKVLAVSRAITGCMKEGGKDCQERVSGCAGDPTP